MVLVVIQVVATDSDLTEPYNIIVYDTAGTSRAEQYFDVDVKTGDIFVKRDLRYPTSRTSETFVLYLTVSIIGNIVTKGVESILYNTCL